MREFASERFVLAKIQQTTLYLHIISIGKCKNIERYVVRYPAAPMIMSLNGERIGDDIIKGNMCLYSWVYGIILG